MSKGPAGETDVLPTTDVLIDWLREHGVLEELLPLI